MTKATPQLDGLRPAERAIYQKMRSQIGRADLNQIVAHLRRLHPVWSDVYNITPERIAEVLERAGLADRVPAGDPATPAAEALSGAADRDVAATRPAGRRGAGRRVPAVAYEPIPERVIEPAARPVQRAQPAPAPTPIADDAGAAVRARRAPAGRPAATGPVRERPGSIRAKPVPPPQTALWSDPVDEPREPVAEAPDLLIDEPENPAAPAAKGRLAVRPPAKKRGAGSVDELLQQLEVLEQEVGRARAEIEQINRRIGDLERRRQVLGDQLALTLRSRVPSEILRLAAGEGAAGKPADAGRGAEAAG